MSDWISEWLPKAFVYGGLFVSTGVAVTQWLQHNRPTRNPTLGRIALSGAVVILVALIARVFVHTAAAFGWSDGFSMENLHTIAIESRWGGRWHLQFGAALILFVTAISADRWSKGWTIYAGAAAAMILTIPLLGHAGGSSTRYAVHAIHLIAGSAWLGSLAVLTMLRMRASGDLSAVIQRFSPLALTSAALVAITGIVMAVLYVATFQNLTGTLYGQTLLWKILWITFVGLCGALNWTRVRKGEVPSARVMGMEVFGALMVILVTSVLTETEHP